MPDLRYISQNFGAVTQQFGARKRHQVRRTLPPGAYVSLCFDDFPQSAVAHAAPLIEAKDWRATWYACGGFVRRIHPEYGEMYSAEDLARLHSAGHEIGCHTHNHVNCQETPLRKVLANQADNLAFFERLGLPCPTSFAYPYGAATPAVKKALRDQMASLRSVDDGWHQGSVDVAHLRAIGIQTDRGGTATAISALEAMAESGGWVIIFTHDVRDYPGPWGCTPEAYRDLLDAVQRSGAEVLPVGEMTARLQRETDLAA